MPAGKALVLSVVGAAVLAGASFPAPALDLPPSDSRPTAPAVLAGGCYWGMQAVFERLRGVLSVTAGYAGAAAVKEGGKGHAESVRIVYDPARISYGALLQVFFAVAHDPTELNRQGPDFGTQYRSAIFYSTEAQKRVAQAYIDQLAQATGIPRSHRDPGDPSFRVLPCRRGPAALRRSPPGFRLRDRERPAQARSPPPLVPPSRCRIGTPAQCRSARGADPWSAASGLLAIMA